MNRRILHLQRATAVRQTHWPSWRSPARQRLANKRSEKQRCKKSVRVVCTLHRGVVSSLPPLKNPDTSAGSSKGWMASLTQRGPPSYKVLSLFYDLFFKPLHNKLFRVWSWTHCNDSYFWLTVLFTALHLGQLLFKFAYACTHIRACLSATSNTPTGPIKLTDT